MNYLRDLIHRLRSGESERRIARDLNVSRPTVHKYRELAEAQGYLQLGSPMPDEATLVAVLGPGPQPPRTPSSVEPYRDIVQRLVDQRVEMAAIFQRLSQDYRYGGSYSAVRRYVRHFRHRMGRIQQNHEMLLAILPEILVNPELRERFYQQFVLPIARLLEQYVQARVDRRDIRPVNVPLTVRAIQSMFVGMLVLRIFGDQALLAGWEAMPEVLADLIFDGLSADGGE
jgi:AcrR family transcriptional regulator